MLEAATTGVVVEVFFNDFPVFRLDPAGADSLYQPVTVYAVSGANVITAYLASGSTPGTSKAGQKPHKAPAGAALDIRLKSYPFGEVPGPTVGKLIQRLQWEATRDEQLPGQLRSKIDLTLPLGPWAWESAPKLDWSPSVESKLLQVLDQLRQAWQAGDTATFLSYFKTRVEEVAQAAGQAPAEALAAKAKRLAAKASDPNWRTFPITPELADFRLVANGRLVQCIGKDWDPLLRATTHPTSPEPTSFHNAMLAKHQGTWQALR